MNHLLDTTDVTLVSVEALHRTADFLMSFNDVVPLLQQLNESTETILDFLEQPKFLRLEKWPTGFLRGLAINHVRLDDTIAFVCTQHMDADKAWKNAQALQELAFSKRCKPLVKMLVTHIKKERVSWERMLHQFEVSVLQVQPGDEFDPSIHHVIDDVVVADAKLVGTIHEAHTACYRWRDENGMDQVREAEVILRKEA